MLTLIILIVGLIFIIGGIIAFFNFTAFSLSYLNTLPTTPEWVTTHNFWAWVAFIILFGITVTIARLIIILTRNIIANTIQIITNNYAAYLITKLALIITGIIIAFPATNAFFNFTTEHSNHTNYFNHNNWFAHILVFIWMIALFAPSEEKNTNT